MFRRGPGRRGAPLLGAAVVIGASRSAARHEVARQGAASQQAQYAADTAAERKQREEEENTRRTQLAIDEAIAKERSRNELINAQARNTESPAGNEGPAENVPAYTQFDREVDAAENKGAAIRYCGQCGNKSKLGDRFCSRCGAKQLDNEKLAVAY
ncbi:hypothetical protein D0Z07_6940 [Hyphodiscus hymeniophilus]|uniref:Uncharacterized protein n=1 Tax=Hyphodiscus hymeniophilus TaxID=353542 RepID=A0A9P6VGC0_9HELO|nr:hypothetical protein D0Z07_6940 [Hyphodiscus hymeniophilus]